MSSLVIIKDKDVLPAVLHPVSLAMMTIACGLLHKHFLEAALTLTKPTLLCKRHACAIEFDMYSVRLPQLRAAFTGSAGLVNCNT